MTYAFIADHASMVFDELRNTAYAKALRTMSPGRIVIDVGAGLGLHGLLAAAAGADHVYLVDPQPLVQIAGEVALKNGLRDKVTVIQRRIEEVDLPHKADVIVSVFTGNMLFSEDLLPSLFDARKRLLKSDGAMLPDRAQLVVAPVRAPKLHDKNVARWSNPVLGMDYRAVRPYAANEPVAPRRDDWQQAELLAEGAVLADLHYVDAASPDCAGEASVTASASGLCDGLACWIRMRVGDSWLTTEPHGPALHWSPVYLPLDPPIRVEAQEQLRLSIQRPAFGDWTWKASTSREERRHSTFLSAADGPSQWRRLKADATPGLAGSGRRALRVLQAMSTGASNDAIAQQLAREERMTSEQALRYVQSMALRYGSAE
jgi:hypothetical protein